MTDNKINVGIIGYGSSAKTFHIPLILTTPSLNLHSIVQRHPTPTNSASHDHPTAQILSSTDNLFTSTSIDLVVITTPPDTHFPLCLSALQAHKHVLVEKPFTPTSSQAEQLIHVARSNRVLLCIYQNRRWDTDFLTFRSLQRDGTLGRIVEFESHFDRYRPVAPTAASSWKGKLGMQEGGGIIYDLGTHLIDQAVVAFGMPGWVSGVFAYTRGDGAEEADGVTILLGYDEADGDGRGTKAGRTGLLVTIKASVMSVSNEQLRFWVRGTHATYEKRHLDVQEEQLKAGRKPGDDGFGIEPEERAGMLTVVEVGGKMVKRILRNVTPETYGALYSRFAEAIRKGDEELVPVKASEARDVLKIVEAAMESATTGRRVEM